jgi:acyl dehydratase/NAD(P)-dependent dehydrogenase (short-subunit alcohol dehydrogenase family)
MVSGAVIATRCFSTDDQVLFARLSGDWNPIHTDPVRSRRTQAGAQVVHGMHTVLWCLEHLAGLYNRPTDIDFLEVGFLRPVLLCDSVTARLTRQTAGELRVSVDVNELQVLRLIAKSSVPQGCNVKNRTPRCPVSAGGFSTRRPSASELFLADLSGRSGVICVDTPADEIRVTFPEASLWLGVARLQALVTLSYLIGMECPGLHSVFSSLAIKFSDGEETTGDRISYMVSEVDERVRLARLDISGMGLSGKLEAFARVPPAAQPSVKRIATGVRQSEFVGDTALIVGGSRGLGEATAKIIAAGGGHPIVTYATGASDAATVRDDILAFGGSCTLLPYDVRKPAAAQLHALNAAPRFVYYFATGAIFRQKWQLFDPDFLVEFLAFYVHGFHALCSELLKRSSTKLYAFYPSSLAVEQRPRGMTEYAMAKAAAEILCQDMAELEPNIEIIMRRLPRIVTDQTATMSPVPAQDACSAMLPIVRALQLRARSSADQSILVKN